MEHQPDLSWLSSFKKGAILGLRQDVPSTKFVNSLAVVLQVLSAQGCSIEIVGMCVTEPEELGAAAVGDVICV